MLKKKNLLPKTLVFFFRLTISVALLCVLIFLIDWKRFVELLQNVDMRFILFPPLILLSSFLFASLRWKILLQGIGIKTRISRLYSYYLSGAFYSIFMPGVIGGDAFRIFLASRTFNANIASIAGSVINERVFGMVALVILGLIASYTTPLAGHIFQNLDAMRLALGLIVMIFFAILWVIITPKKLFDRCFRWIRPGRIKSVLDQTLSTFSKLSIYSCISTLILSLLFQGFDIMASFMLAKALNLSVTINYFFLIFPIVYIVTVLPISLGGLGVREGILSFLLVYANIDVTDAVSLALLIHINRVIIGSIGGFLQISSKFDDRKDRLRQQIISRNMDPK